jgi:LuxR family maltose regulon positive regulatory protein
MSESTTVGPVTRSHIIKRPRLTQLLDETTARIILLIAPAGYGKTTLAREWCDMRDGRSAWYRAGPSAGDVAALVTDLSRVMEKLVPASGERVRNYLRGSEATERDVQTIASLLTQELIDWPDDALLVIDDYHHAEASEASETLIGLLAENAPVQLLLTSRRIPSWASARQFIYGQVLEIGRDGLAMTDAEVDLALPLAGPHEAMRLRSLADGWPALIGLAALTSGSHPPATAERLHAYFAQELFEAAPSDVQSALIKLAVLPTITRPLAEAALGKEPSLELSHAARAGFFTSHDDTTYELHPLLREVLLT